MIRNLLIIPAYFVAAVLAAWGANWLAARKWRRAASTHWSERARLLWPVRQGAASSLYFLPAGFAMLQFVIDARFSAWCGAAGLAAWLGALLGTYPLDREIFPQLTFRSWLRLNVIIWLMRIVTCVLWIIGGLLMPAEINGWAFLVVGGFLAFLITLNWPIWRRLLTGVKVLFPSDNRLQGIVAMTAHRMGLPVPESFLVEVPLANALALPLTRELIFTTRLMEICGDDEVSTICAHEFAHLTESKGVVFLRVLTSSLVWLPYLFIRPILHAYGPGGLVILPLGLAARPLGRLLSRRMEKRADHAAIELQGDSGVYARALEKLYRESQIPAVNATRHKTHPHLYDRILAAGVSPDFERPEPPDAMSGFYVLLWLGMGVLIGLAMTGVDFWRKHRVGAEIVICIPI